MIRVGYLFRESLLVVELRLETSELLGRGSPDPRLPGLLLALPLLIVQPSAMPLPVKLDVLVLWHDLTIKELRKMNYVVKAFEN